MNADKAHNPADAEALVILPAEDIRLPEVLNHIETGKTVLVMLPPSTKPKHKQD